MKAQILLVGTLLTTGKRTVTAALRAMGLQDDMKFAQYHQVLNRAVWCPLELAQVLLRLLLRTFYGADEPVVCGIDETIERRGGHKIAARGIYRDPVRSSKRHFVKASGLRWISLMRLTPIPWAQRIWTLPGMSALAPSEQYYETRGRKAKTLTERAWQMIKQLRRWLPNRAVVIVGDNSYAALDLLAACQALSEPGCAGLRLCTNLRLPLQAWGGLAKSERACLPRSRCWTRRIRPGRPSTCVGTTGRRATWNSCRGLLCGFITAKPPCLFVGCWSVIRKVSMKPCVCCVPTRPSLRTRLSNGL
jgi:hypothetical protein